MADKPKSDISNEVTSNSYGTELPADMQGTTQELPGYGANSYGSLTPEAMEQAQKEYQLALEFDNPAAAAALAAARGFTGGLSDVYLTQAGLLSPETIKQYKEQNPIASPLGEAGGFATGIIGPGKVISPVGKLTQVSEAIGAAAGKQLTSKAAQKIVEGAVREGVAGAGLSVGQYASDVALENQKLSAESLIGHVGPGLLIGGGFGTVLGLGAAAVPAVKNLGKITGINERLNEVKNYLVDPVPAAREWIGLTPSEAVKLDGRAPVGNRFSDKLPNYITENLLGAERGAKETLADVNARVLSKAGKQIDQYVSLLDKEAIHSPELVTNTNPFQRLQTIVDEERQLLSEAPSKNADQLRNLAGVEKDLRLRQARFLEKQQEILAATQGLGKMPETGLVRELDNLRRYEQGIKYNKFGTELHNWRAELAGQLRRELRDIQMEIAESYGNQVGGVAKEVLPALKQANETYHIGDKIQPRLLKQAAKAPNLKIFNPFMIAENVVKGANSVRRSAVLHAAVGQRVQATQQFIASATKQFFEKAVKPTKLGSLKLMTDSGFALTDDGKKPANNKMAFKNIQSHLMALNNADVLTEKLAKNIGPLMQLNPTLGFEAQKHLSRAITFLNAKLPKHMGSGSPQLLFPKEYEPTTMELAKFQRYLQAVEQPLSVIDELEQGTITREHVEALKFVYPEIYGALQQEVLGQVSTNPDISYQKKLQLGILLDIPTDESLTGESIMGLQSTFSADGGDSQQQPANGNVQAVQANNLGKINVAERADTDVEALARRRG